jgi:hypothetical protein
MTLAKKKWHTFSTSLQIWLREREASSRVLPHFLIIGAMKSGTTSLYDAICRHPKVEPALLKEVHYFDHNYRRGLAWYRAHFPRAAAGRISGEASPYYLFHPACPERVFHTLPEVKLIAILRDPVTRAYSHYQYEKKKGREQRSFSAATQTEQQLLTSSGGKGFEAPGSFEHQYFSYLSRGLYARQLDGWLNYFRPEQLLVLKGETFFQEPAAVMAQVFSFLGLSAWQPESYETLNQGRYDGLDATTYQTLQTFFLPHNEALRQKYGIAFDERG